LALQRGAPRSFSAPVTPLFRQQLLVTLADNCEAKTAQANILHGSLSTFGMFIEIEPILSITGQMSILLMLQQISSCAATTDSEAAVLVIPMDLPCTSKPDESEETDRICWASNPAALYRSGVGKIVESPPLRSTSSLLGSNAKSNYTFVGIC